MCTVGGLVNMRPDARTNAPHGLCPKQSTQVVDRALLLFCCFAITEGTSELKSGTGATWMVTEGTSALQSGTGATWVASYTVLALVAAFWLL